MARSGTKGGSVYVEIALERAQFDKDFKAAQREISAAQQKLSLDLQRNKVQFAIDGIDKGWAEKMFGSTTIGKIVQARKETSFLNDQIRTQSDKVELARGAWEKVANATGLMSKSSVTAEKAFLREQMALVGLNKEMDGTTTASAVMGGAMKSAALTAAAAVTALAAAYATAAKAAISWGQAVNDIVDETGMADASAAQMLGTMNIVGLSSEEAAGAIAKLAKNINTASTAQALAAKNGKDSEDVFTKYGIAIKGADGQLLDHAQILANIQEVHGKMQDGLQKTSMEMEIFGKSGYKMNDYLNLSKEQMKDYTDKIDKMGLAIKDSQKYEDFNRQLNEMKLAFVGIATTITGDDIPALTKMIGKLTELSGWMRENKDVWDELKGYGARAISNNPITSPVVAGVNMAIGALKRLVEAREAAIKSDKPLSSETDFVSRQAQSLKNAEELAKKQSDLNRAKAAAEKDLIFAQRELNDAILSLQGKTLEVQLLNIGREKEAWIKKTKDEVAATKWAEAAKTKAFQDAMDARLGPEVAAAKKAILEGTSVGDAIYKASTQRKEEERATYEARQQVKKYYGIAEPGDEIKTLQVDYLKNTITQMTEIAKALTIPKDRNGRTIFDQYQPAPAAPMYTDANGNRTNGIPQGQPGSIFITVPVSIDGQQVGNAAAKIITPVVQGAIAQAQTQYGGR